MTYLGDYLGQLLSEIAMARVQADVETVRIAELYAAHPLLRVMPIPHIRLPDVELEVPVLIKTSAEPRPGESTRGGAPIAELRKIFEPVVANALARANVALTAPETKRLHEALNARLAGHDAPTETSGDVLRLADDLATETIRVVAELRPVARGGAPALSETAAADLRNSLRVEFLKARSDPPRLTVSVTSAEIREGATSDNLTRIRLKVMEQGVEWTSIESNGVSRDRLVPE